jgi:hypothetical protein
MNSTEKIFSEVQNKIFKRYLSENPLNEDEIIMFKEYLLAYPLYTDIKNEFFY